MKKIALIILALLVGISVFAKQHKKKKKKHQQVNEVVSLGLFRTGCYGRCPTYKINLKSDGMATYSAIRFNDDTGDFTKNIGVAKAKEVLDQVTTYRLDTCKNLYRSRAADLPGMILTIQYRDSTKTIKNANFGPAFFMEIADALDEAAKKKDNSWKKIEAPKTK